MSIAKEFLEKFADIHPLPHIVSSVNNLINDPDSTMKDFEDVIKMDPVLVSRLLTLVNSPFYGLTQTVDSIGRAVAFLGMKNLHNLVVADALRNIFAEKDELPGFSKKELWTHCAAVSICSKMVAERIFGLNGDDAFLCGILHDFGLLIEQQLKPEEFLSICSSVTSPVQLVEAEQEAFGTNHCELGYMMTLDWNMPVNIQEAIRDHHLIDDSIQPNSLTGIMQIAEYIASELEYNTLPGVGATIPDQLMTHLQDNMDEYTILIEDLPEEMEKAQALYG